MPVHPCRMRLPEPPAADLYLSPQSRKSRHLPLLPTRYMPVIQTVPLPATTVAACWTAVVWRIRAPD